MSTVPHSACLKCGVEKPVTDYYLDRGTPRRTCKTCIRADRAEYRRTHPDRIRASSKKHYEKHGHQIKSRLRDRYANDPEYRESTLRRNQEYHHSHRESILPRLRANGQKYKEERRAKFLVRMSEDRARMRSLQSAAWWRRQLRLSSQNCGCVTAQHVQILRGLQCVYCGGPSQHADHLLALSRGGMHCIENLQPACISCNSSKQARLVDDFLAQIGRPNDTIVPLWRCTGPANG